MPPQSLHQPRFIESTTTAGGSRGVPSPKSPRQSPARLHSRILLQQLRQLLLEPHQPLLRQLRVVRQPLPAGQGSAGSAWTPGRAPWGTGTGTGTGLEGFGGTWPGAAPRTPVPCCRRLWPWPWLSGPAPAPSAPAPSAPRGCQPLQERAWWDRGHKAPRLCPPVLPPSTPTPPPAAPWPLLAPSARTAVQASRNSRDTFMAGERAERRMWGSTGVPSPSPSQHDPHQGCPHSPAPGSVRRGQPWALSLYLPHGLPWGICAKVRAGRGGLQGSCVQPGVGKWRRDGACGAPRVCERAHCCSQLFTAGCARLCARPGARSRGQPWAHTAQG